MGTPSVCTTCHHRFTPSRLTPGRLSLAGGFTLLTVALALSVPALGGFGPILAVIFLACAVHAIYRRPKCPSCGSDEHIPADSPRAREMTKKRTGLVYQGSDGRLHRASKGESAIGIAKSTDPQHRCI